MMRSKRRGVLTFEWILVLTILVIGIVGGLAAVRDAQIVELASAAEAIISLNSSYTIQAPVKPILVTQGYAGYRDITGKVPASAASGSNYEDTFSRTNDDNVQVTVLDPTVLPEDMPKGKEEVKAVVFTEIAAAQGGGGGNGQGAAPVRPENAVAMGRGFSGEAAVPGAAESPSASASSNASDASGRSLSPAAVVTSSGSGSGGGSSASAFQSIAAGPSNGSALAATTGANGSSDANASGGKYGSNGTGSSASVAMAADSAGSAGSAGAAGAAGSASSADAKGKPKSDWMSPPVDEDQIAQIEPNALRPAAPVAREAAALTDVTAGEDWLPQVDLRPVQPKRASGPVVRLDTRVASTVDSRATDASTRPVGIQAAVANPAARDTRTVRAPVADPQVRQAAAFELAHSGRVVTDGVTTADWTRITPPTDVRQ